MMANSCVCQKLLLAESKFDRFSRKQWDDSRSTFLFKFLSVWCHRIRWWV